jgi:hypothetical protein
MEEHNILLVYASFRSEFNLWIYSREMKAVFHKTALSYMQLCQLLRLRSVMGKASRIITFRGLGTMWNVASADNNKKFRSLSFWSLLRFEESTCRIWSGIFPFYMITIIPVLLVRQISYWALFTFWVRRVFNVHGVWGIGSVIVVKQLAAIVLTDVLYSLIEKSLLKTRMELGNFEPRLEVRR